MAAQNFPPYGRNLIKNPCGEDGMKYWDYQTRVMKYWEYQNGEDIWKVEKELAEAEDFNRVEELKLAGKISASGVKSCFATSSYPKCPKHQTIELIREGFQEFILDHVQPEIKIGDWHAARFGCLYDLTVLLLDNTGKQMTSFSTGSIYGPRMTGPKWQKVEHSFSNYGPGVRFVKFIQTGANVLPRKGHYGSLMTASSIVVAKPPNGKEIDIKVSPRERIVYLYHEHNKPNLGLLGSCLCRHENLECIICLTEEKNTLFLPCRHVTCCHICSERVMKGDRPRCPTCRSVIECTLKIYL